MNYFEFEDKRIRCIVAPLNYVLHSVQYKLDYWYKPTENA